MMDVNDRKRMLRETFNSQFGGDPQVWVRAPGRVDLMGSHTDYNQGYVMTTAIDRDIWLFGRHSSESIVHLYSVNLNSRASFGLSGLQDRRDSLDQWLRYPAGVADELIKTGRVLKGFEAVIHSTVPIGSGLSSSAALEAATACLFQAGSGWSMAKKDMALLCRRAENNYVGMNCGILDQYSSILAEEGTTVLLDCRTISHKAVPYPTDIGIVICNTNSPRQLTGSEYGTRRAQCEEGVRILKDFCPEITALRDVHREQFETFKHHLSPVVAKRCQFIIQENRRVLDLAEALKNDDREQMRNLFVRSFEGARDLYEISVPAMESMMEAMMHGPGVIGGRNAGAGFGGCMVALVESVRVKEFAASVKEEYDKHSGLVSEIYPVVSAEGAGPVQ